MYIKSSSYFVNHYWILYYHGWQSMVIDNINRIVVIYLLSISRSLNSKIILQYATKKVLDKLFDFCYNEPIKNEDGN